MIVDLYGTAPWTIIVNTWQHVLSGADQNTPGGLYKYRCNPLGSIFIIFISFYFRAIILTISIDFVCCGVNCYFKKINILVIFRAGNMSQQLKRFDKLVQTIQYIYTSFIPVFKGNVYSQRLPSTGRSCKHLSYHQSCKVLYREFVEKTRGDVLPAVRYHCLCQTQRNTNYDNLNWVAVQLTYL